MGFETSQDAINDAVHDAYRDDALNRALNEALVENTTHSQLNTLSLDTSLRPIPKPIETIEVKKQIETSRKLIGGEEWDFFIKYFGLSEDDPISIVKEIKSIQGGGKADGIIDPIMLEKIYNEYYRNNYENLGDLQKWRLTIYDEMKNYPPKTRKVMHLNATVTLYPSSKPRVFSRGYYFGETDGHPLGGRGINSELFPYVEKTISRQDTVVYMRKIQGKYALIGYIGGELAFASYTSPGNPNIRDGSLTPKGSWSSSRGKQFSDRYWITGAKSSVRIRNQRYISDIMPYAVWVEGGIFGHAGNTNGMRRSHGCMRLPLHYAKILYEIYESSGGQMAWEIEEN